MRILLLLRRLVWDMSPKSIDCEGLKLQEGVTLCQSEGPHGTVMSFSPPVVCMGESRRTRKGYHPHFINSLVTVRYNDPGFDSTE